MVDTEGWLHTGDVGEWQPNGTLKIIDHKKQIFKLSRGEYVAPDKVEAIYKKSPYVAQVMHYVGLLSSCWNFYYNSQPLAIHSNQRKDQ